MVVLHCFFELDPLIGDVMLADRSSDYLVWTLMGGSHCSIDTRRTRCVAKGGFLGEFEEEVCLVWCFVWDILFFFFLHSTSLMRWRIVLALAGGCMLRLPAEWSDHGFFFRDGGLYGGFLTCLFWGRRVCMYVCMGKGSE